MKAFDSIIKEEEKEENQCKWVCCASLLFDLIEKLVKELLSN